MARAARSAQLALLQVDSTDPVPPVSVLPPVTAVDLSTLCIPLDWVDVSPTMACGHVEQFGKRSPEWARFLMAASAGTSRCQECIAVDRWCLVT